MALLCCASPCSFIDTTSLTLRASSILCQLQSESSNRKHRSKTDRGSARIGALHCLTIIAIALEGQMTPVCTSSSSRRQSRARPCSVLPSQTAIFRARKAPAMRAGAAVRVTVFRRGYNRSHFVRPPTDPPPDFGAVSSRYDDGRVCCYENLARCGLVSRFREGHEVFQETRNSMGFKPMFESHRSGQRGVIRPRRAAALNDQPR